MGMRRWLGLKQKKVIDRSLSERNMVLFIGGMPRSGSTFTFAVAREILLMSGSVYARPGADYVGTNAAAGSAQYLVLKAHKADDFVIDEIQNRRFRCICSVRSLEDAVASWIETFDFSVEQTIIDMRSWVAMYLRIENSCLTISYDDIENRPQNTVARIAEYLEIPVGRDQAASIASVYSKKAVRQWTNALSKDDPMVRNKGFTWYDINTLFHRRHVSSLAHRPASQRISATDLERLKSALMPEIQHVNRILEKTP